jgi:hypothetical protein
MRCKVVCNLKKLTNTDAQLSFAPVYSGSEENKEFFKYTPGGDFSIYTVNLDVASHFEMGKEYYVDFSPAS